MLVAYLKDRDMLRALGASCQYVRVVTNSPSINRVSTFSPSRANFGKRELPCQRDDLVPVPPGGWLRSAQREEPLRVGGLPQVQLRTAEMRLNAPWILHGFDALVIGRQLEPILGERGDLIFNLERAFVHPDGDLFTRQAVFAKEPPVFEADIAMRIERAGKLRRIQHAGEDLVGVGASQHATQHGLWAVPPVLARTMGEMMFAIVIGPPGSVRPLDLWPGPRVIGSRPVCALPGPESDARESSDGRSDRAERVSWWRCV
jgi:hypothetical protein